jgi:diguanylate cyclase (GGDEF)-like protein
MLKKRSSNHIMHKFDLLLPVAIVSPVVFPILAMIIGWRILAWASLLLSAILAVYVIHLSRMLRERSLVMDAACWNLPDGLLLLNDQLHIVYVNRVAQRILGTAQGGQPVDAIIAKLFLQHERLMSLWESRDPGKAEVELGDRLLELQLIPLELGLTRLFFMIVMRDVTEERRYEVELLRQANTDGLTNLLNRRSFLEKLEDARQQCVTSGSTISLALVDVDYFKHINDRYGHLEGDRVLQHVADVLLEVAGENGVAGRIGGEEFAVYWPGTEGEAALQLTEKLRLRVLEGQPGLASSRSGTDGSEPAYTISAGVAELEGPHMTLESWLETADACLYASKQNGRNRSTLAKQRKRC